MDPRIPELIAALDRACRAAGFEDFMPSAMIGHFVRQVTPSSLEGNQFVLNQFYQWVRQEYSIPDSAFGRAFNLFGPDIARLGVTAIEPTNFDPGFGETIRSWLIGTMDGNEAEAAAAAAAPHIPISEIEQTEVMPPDYELPLDPAAVAPDDFSPPAETAAPADEPVTYGVPVDEPEGPVEVIGSEPIEPAPAEETAEGVAEPEPLPAEAYVTEAEAEATAAGPADGEVEEVPVPIDDSAIVADPAEALPAPAEAAPEAGYCSPEEELAALRAQVAVELRRELWPVVYEEVKVLVAGEVRPALEEEVRARLTAELRPMVERELAESIRAELYAELHEKVTAELRAAEHAPVAAEVRARIEDTVREELRRELWETVRAEVKEDLSSVMQPGPVATVVDEDFTLPPAPAPAALASATAPCGEADERGLGLGADDQLLIIRRLRERLAPALREQFARELTALAHSLREQESEKERERRMSDPEWCREQVRQYFFPDQPALWERVKPHVDPKRWGDLVRALSRGNYDADRLARSRPVVREALMLKAEIESEMGSAPPRGVPRPRALAEALTGADRALDFALDSLSAMINGV